VKSSNFDTKCDRKLSTSRIHHILNHLLTVPLAKVGIIKKMTDFQQRHFGGGGVPLPPQNDDHHFQPTSRPTSGHIVSKFSWSTCNNIHTLFCILCFVFTITFAICIVRKRFWCRSIRLEKSFQTTPKSSFDDKSCESCDQNKWSS